MSESPQFSVLLPVYANDPEWLFVEAVRSVTIAQTLPPSQIVVVQDGPLKWSIEESLGFLDGRGAKLTVVKSAKNIGLAKALNLGLAACQHEIVFRMDADDIAVPDRFEIQLPFFCKNKNLAIHGGWAVQMDYDMKEVVGIRKVPLGRRDVAAFARKRTPINHMTIGFRRSLIEAVGGYPQYRLPFEDWWLTLSVLKAGGVIENVDKVLCKVRTGSDFYARRSGWRYLRMEWENLRLMRAANLMSTWDFLFNVVLRTLIRALPSSAVRGVYRRFLVERVA